MSLAASKLDQCRRRIQRAITGRRGRAGDRLYRARRTLHTGAGLLTDAQAERLENLFADDRHAAVQASWGVYQRLIQAYRTEEAGLGKYLMQRLIDSLRQTIPDGLEEIQTLARTLTERASDILAYFDRPRTSNGPTEAINGRLEHLRGIALGFRNLASYTIRSLIHTGRLKDHLKATTSTSRQAPPTTPSNTKSRKSLPRPLPLYSCQWAYRRPQGQVTSFDTGLTMLNSEASSTVPMRCAWMTATHPLSLIGEQNGFGE